MDNIEAVYMATPNAVNKIIELIFTGSNFLAITKKNPMTSDPIKGVTIEPVMEKLTYFLAIIIAIIDDAPTNAYPIEAPVTPYLAASRGIDTQERTVHIIIR